MYPLGYRYLAIYIVYLPTNRLRAVLHRDAEITQYDLYLHDIGTNTIYTYLTNHTCNNKYHSTPPRN